MQAGCQGGGHQVFSHYYFFFFFPAFFAGFARGGSSVLGFAAFAFGADACAAAALLSAFFTDAPSPFSPLLTFDFRRVLQNFRLVHRRTCRARRFRHTRGHSQLRGGSFGRGGPPGRGGVCGRSRFVAQRAVVQPFGNIRGQLFLGFRADEDADVSALELVEGFINRTHEVVKRLGRAGRDKVVGAGVDVEQRHLYIFQVHLFAVYREALLLPACSAGTFPL